MSSRRRGRKAIPTASPKVTALRLSKMALCVIAAIGGYESLTSYNRVECPGGFGRIEGHMQILGTGGLRDQAVALSTRYAMYAAKREHGLLDAPAPTDRVYCAGHEWADAMGIYCEPAPPLKVIPLTREQREELAALRTEFDGITPATGEGIDTLADGVPVYVRKDGDKVLAEVADKAVEGRDYATA